VLGGAAIFSPDFKKRVSQQELALKDATISRRFAVGSALAIAASGVLALTATTSFAQKKSGPAEVPVEELMKATDLPEIALGPADAKVTIVEYASMTCGHCQKFSTTVFPELKTKYIDSGKIRFIMREFPLDNLAAAASMLARCAGGEKTFPMIETLYEKQADWAFTQGNPVPKLFDIAKQAGFTQESFDKCLTDQKLLDQITTGRTRASDTFGVSATPTFFINGKRLTETPVIASFDKMIEPLLAAK
jgi:protein-disulfide isomerase